MTAQGKTNAGGEITFVLNANDIRAMDAVAARPYKQAAIRRPLIILALLPIVMAVVFFQTQRENVSLATLLSKAAPVLIGVPLLIAVLFGGWWAVTLWNARASQYTPEKLAATLPIFGKEQAVRLSADGVHLRDVTGESRTEWQSVKALEEDSERIYLLYANGTMSPIPKRAFADATEMTKFIDLVRSHSK